MQRRRYKVSAVVRPVGATARYCLRGTDAATPYFVGENTRPRKRRRNPRLCPICGSPVPESKGLRGRPRLYDTAHCTEIASIIGRLGTLIDAHVDRVQRGGELTADQRVALSHLRADLFALANLVNRAGRPVASPRTVRTRTRAGWRGLKPGGLGA